MQEIYDNVVHAMDHIVIIITTTSGPVTKFIIIIYKAYLTITGFSDPATKPKPSSG